MTSSGGVPGGTFDVLGDEAIELGLRGGELRREIGCGGGFGRGRRLLRCAGAEVDAGEGLGVCGRSEGDQAESEQEAHRGC